MLNLLINN